MRSLHSTSGCNAERAENNCSVEAPAHLCCKARIEPLLDSMADRIRGMVHNPRVELAAQEGSGPDAQQAGAATTARAALTAAAAIAASAAVRVPGAFASAEPAPAAERPPDGGQPASAAPLPAAAQQGGGAAPLGGEGPHVEAGEPAPPGVLEVYTTRSTGTVTVVDRY